MKKRKIYYARTYRHLKIDKIKSIITMCFMIIITLFLFILNLHNITHFLCKRVVSILGEVFRGIPLYIEQTDFTVLGVIDYVNLPTVFPDIAFVFMNFVVMLFLLLFLGSGKRRGKPLSIYMTLGVLIHMINCIYFIFASNYFPYTAREYSILYMKQQVGIWITFIVLSGLVLGLMGNRGLVAKILAFLGIMTYSFIFGAVRYIVFLYMIQEFSILYMAVMFFILGPFFDFLYLVSIYGVFIDKMVRLYDSDKGREEWKWS